MALLQSIRKQKSENGPAVVDCNRAPLIGECRRDVPLPTAGIDKRRAFAPHECESAGKIMTRGGRISRIIVGGAIRILAGLALLLLLVTSQCVWQSRSPNAVDQGD